ncbi:acyl-CoA dehydrogenase family protein [Nocardioides ochotonae]|uniref:acyl-CoA dehydrogenase family protein n=1 Tax=Nocardioides ochotonae TaxID=2685869 RepID=UPI00140AA7D0|nr:acyl-CoA dehydrogenase family protein [Nocardioides ochotonae]
MHDLVSRARAIAPQLAQHAAETETLGRLSDASVALIKEAGVMRALQPVEYGGLAAHPADFAQAVMEVAQGCGSSGWVCGVGGVHPWEMALMDRKLQDEVWGTDQDTWIASPYMPSGVATEVDGGYVLNGHWQFSSGTDHCDWVFLGAVVGDREGRPVQPFRAMHVVLPRADYTILEDSWDVIGLRGTGSKDVVVKGAFIPAYRTIGTEEVTEGEVAAVRAGRTESLYKLPFWTMFPLGITSAVIGIAEGALRAHLDYQRDRVSAYGGKVREDTTTLKAIAESSTEIAASRLQLLDGVSRIHDKVEAGLPVTFADRAMQRRNQILAAWRAVGAVDAIFARSGGNAARRYTTLQRFWRDAHVGLQHAIHVKGTALDAAALIEMGVEPEGPLRAMI